MTGPKGDTLQILTVTSMKGGVGKTTISAMLARYATDRAPHSVMVIDLDPQAGISSLLLGGKIDGPIVADLLESESRGVSSAGLFREAARPSRYCDQILVVPSGAALADFAASNSPAPLNLLAQALETALIPHNTIVIVDTGTSPGLVRLGIAAADTIVIPVMFSQQTARPTINTLMLASRTAGAHGALAPVGMGKTQWENRELGRWRKQLLSDDALVAMGFSVLPPLPYSKMIVRGQWRYGTFPQQCEPFFEALYSLAVQRERVRTTLGSHMPAANSLLPDQEQTPVVAEITAQEWQRQLEREGLLHGA